MNAAEYAKHRGVSKVQISRDIQNGKIPAKRVGRGYVIDQVEADRAYDGALAPDRGGRNQAPDIDAALQARKAREAAIPAFAVSRAAREAFSARLTELEFRQRSGKLVDKDELKLKLAKLHMGVRDALRTIPDRVAPIIAAEKDQAVIHAMLLKEIEQALEGLSGLSD
jgi:hypothetical protein